jgi:hypothetical protein
MHPYGDQPYAPVVVVYAREKCLGRSRMPPA